MTDTTINSSSSTISTGQAGQLSTVSSSPITRMSNYVNQPAFKRSLPLIVSIVFAGVVLIFFALSQKPSLTSLYDSLSASADAARAVVILREREEQAGGEREVARRDDDDVEGQGELHADDPARAPPDGLELDPQRVEAEERGAHVRKEPRAER